mmetsp:Transcript_61447/g.163561  ORF Transcript_61447/g.163561 Transcript_61447/m.163561 type:complete len:117 (-) Transcript_61447:181-531(-)
MQCRSSGPGSGLFERDAKSARSARSPSISENKRSTLFIKFASELTVGGGATGEVSKLVGVHPIDAVEGTAVLGVDMVRGQYRSGETGAGAPGESPEKTQDVEGCIVGHLGITGSGV